MPVTEIATIPLSAGLNVLEQDSEAANIWQDMLTIIAQQDGCRDIYSGLQHETPNMAQLFIVWDTIADHQRFQELPVYGQMLKTLKPVLDGSPQLVHFDLKSPGELSAATSAPVTEVATLFLPKKISSFNDKMSSFAKILNEHAEGFLGCAYSWIMEDVEHESFGPGIKGRAFLLAIGWSSISAHMAFKKTGAFQENLELFQDARASEIHHTTFGPRPEASPHDVV